MQIDYLRVALSLLLCLGLGIGAIALMRIRLRGGLARRTRELSLIDSLRVDPRTSVHLVRYRREHLLIASNDQAVQILRLRGAEESRASHASAEADRSHNAGEGP